MIDAFLELLEAVSYIAVVFVVIMMVAGPVIEFIFSIFLSSDNFFDHDDDDDGYGF